MAEVEEAGMIQDGNHPCKLLVDRQQQRMLELAMPKLFVQRFEDILV